MANNQYANKLIVNDQILLDLTGDTIIPSDLKNGVTAHDKSGAPITGSLVVPVVQASKTYQVLSNGNYTVTPDSGNDAMEEVELSVEIASGLPIEIDTDAGMSAVLISENVGKLYKYTGTTGKYINGELYKVAADDVYYFVHCLQIPDYLCFVAEQANSTIEMVSNGSLTKSQAFEYSTDGFTWSPITLNSTIITLSNLGDKVYIRGNNTTVSESTSKYISFSMTGLISASGNVMSLLDKTVQSRTLSANYCFYKLFNACSSLTTAPRLPATTITEHCYDSMFYDCTSLTTAPPKLPATTLQTYCYKGIFYGCTSLIIIPSILPATTLKIGCYSYMFTSCESLTIPPTISATTLASACCEFMFADCASLITVPYLRATTLATYCYQYMFYGCISLRVNRSGSYAWRIPTSGRISSVPSDALELMLEGTGGNVTSMYINTNFYVSNKPV